MLRIIKISFIFFPTFLHGFAAYDVMIGHAAQVALAQTAALQADALARNLHQANALISHDLMIRYDHTYETMLGQQIMHQSLGELQPLTIPADYHMQPSTGVRTNNALSEAFASSSSSSAAEDIREFILNRMHEPCAYRHELPLISPTAEHALRQQTRQSLGDHHIESWRLARQTNFQNNDISGYTKKHIISAIRHSTAAKKIINEINQQFIDLCETFETARLTGDFHKTLKLLADIHMNTEKLKKLGPIAYLLKPAIANTIHHIEWPLLKCALDKKNCLKPRDYEQIAWAIESHFKSMQRYTCDTKICLPDGILKNIVNDYYKAQYGWLGRLYKNLRHYPVYASRDLSNLEALRNDYQELLRKNQDQRNSQTPITSSSSIVDTDRAIDYAQLLNETKAQHAAIFQKTGKISEYHLSRESALTHRAQGDHSTQTKSYTLNPQAQQKLEKAGIDTRQFTECTGNLIQQDTHAKLVNTINFLADYRPTTEHGQHIKMGTIDCVQAGVQLNKEGHVREAMHIADFCCSVAEKAIHFLDSITPLGLIADTSVSALRAAAAHDLADSIETFRASADKFRAGFVVGVVQGVTDIEGIYNGLSDTVNALQDLIHIMDDAFLFEEGLESGRYDIMQPIIERNQERCDNIAAAASYVVQQSAEFIDHAADMTPEEWGQAGLTTGNFVGRETAQLGVIHIGLSGLGKIGQGIAGSARNFRTTAQELLIAGQFSGQPAAESLAQTIGRLHRVENVAAHIGSQHISGIPAVHPEFGSRVIINTGEQFIERATQVIADTSSGIASQTATMLQLGKQLGSSLTEAKPGFLQLPGGSSDGSSQEKPSAERFTKKVGNMRELLLTSFGQTLKDKIQKTNYKHKGALIYKITEKIAHADLKKGDLIYLDSLHMDHLEVFNKQGVVRFVLNLDGSVNKAKSESAIKEMRTIKT